MSATPPGTAAGLQQGLALHQQGDLVGAEASYRKALDADPGNADALHLLGMVCFARGDNDQARNLIEQAISRDPDCAQFHGNLGNVLQRTKLYDEAIIRYGKAIELEPGSPIFQNNLGNALAALERNEEAEIAYRRALARDPAYSSAVINLGNVLQRLKRYDESIACYRKALAAAPESAEILANLGNVFHMVGRRDEAQEFLTRAVTIDPRSALAHNSLGILKEDLGDFADAEAAYARAVELDPDFPSSRLNLARMFLLAGRFDEAWTHYVHRSSVRAIRGDFGGRGLTQEPLPADLSGRRILILKDQGLGDEIFFLRFASMLKARGAELGYVADPKIAALVRRTDFLDVVMAVAGVPESVPAGWENADHFISVGDLPLVLGTAWNRANLPPVYAIPPLAGRIDETRARLAAFGPPPYVAVTWRAGTPDTPGSVFKMAPLAPLGRALAATMATLIAVQRLPETGEVERLAEHAGRPVHDATGFNDDLETMLAAMSLFDGYVAVSNTNLHLRGATGGASHVLVPHPPEFRWMAEGDESPWFPRTRVYRECPGGDWGAALEGLATDLAHDFGAQ
jgi:tetratricopeptide (TPR) repeat protein